MACSLYGNLRRISICKHSQKDADRIKFVGIDAIVGIDAVIDGRLDASFLYPPGGEFVCVRGCWSSCVCVCVR